MVIQGDKAAQERITERGDLLKVPGKKKILDKNLYLGITAGRKATHFGRVL